MTVGLELLKRTQNPDGSEYAINRSRRGRMTEILYIEDNEFDRYAFSKAMDDGGEYEISYATSVGEAMELLRQHKFRLVICDFQLPDGNAFNVLDLKPDIPVIVLTGQGSEDTAILSIQKGAKDYIFKDINGKHLSIIPVVIEKVLRLDEAEHAQALLAAIVETAADAIFTINSQHEITSWNKGAERIYGYRSSEVIGKQGDLLCMDKKLPLEKRVDMVYRSQTASYGQSVHIRKNGEFFAVSLSVSPVLDTTGKVCSISLIARDISEMIKQQALLEKKEQELQKSREVDAKKDEFISIASHELKTPLTTLKAYVQLLEKEAGSDPGQLMKSVKKTSQHLKKLEILINDLLNISRIESGKLSYSFENFDFDKMVSEVVDSISKCAQSHRLVIKGQTGLTVNGDRLRLEEVLNNFLTNALKFSPPAKEIEVILTNTAGKEVTLCVKDHGPGIAEKDLGNIFKRYFRSDNNSTKTPGLGIGLYIAKEIIERHHGKVWVRSKKGDGAEFYFTIPVEQP